MNTLESISAKLGAFNTEKRKFRSLHPLTWVWIIIATIIWIVDAAIKFLKEWLEMMDNDLTWW